MGCSHFVSREGRERDGGKHEKLPPCWKVVWMVGIRVVELTRPHDGGSSRAELWQAGSSTCGRCAKKEERCVRIDEGKRTGR